MNNQDQPLSPSGKQELETLRVLLNLPKDVLHRFEPHRPPQPIERYVQRAPRRELQWLLVDVLHRLRTHPDNRPSGDAPPNNNNGHGD